MPYELNYVFNIFSLIDNQIKRTILPMVHDRYTNIIQSRCGPPKYCRIFLNLFMMIYIWYWNEIR